jgi:hypothetical protein
MLDKEYQSYSYNDKNEDLEYDESNQCSFIEDSHILIIIHDERYRNCCGIMNQGSSFLSVSDI